MRIDNYTREQGWQVSRHCRRDRDPSCKFGNRSIDKTRTELNSDLLGVIHEGRKVPFMPYSEAIDFWVSRSEKTTGRKVAKTANVMEGVVLNLPGEYCPPEGVDLKAWYASDPNRMKREHEFFQKAFHFLLEKFGVFVTIKDGEEERIVSNFLHSCIHRDETGQIHMHVGFCPVVKETRRYTKKVKGNGEREIEVKAGSLSSYEVINKGVLTGLHEELDAYLKDNLEWYTGGVLLPENERMRKGQNMTIDELKASPEGTAAMRNHLNALESIREQLESTDPQDIAEAKRLIQEAAEASRNENLPPPVLLVQLLVENNLIGTVVNNREYGRSIKLHREYMTALKGIKDVFVRRFPSILKDMGMAPEAPAETTPPTAEEALKELERAARRRSREGKGGRGGRYD